MLTATSRADDLAQLFAGLADAPALCLAVSGGPDSTALLALAVRWRAALPHGPRLHVATVDHGLRPEAATEAAAVAALAARFGLVHATLPWLASKPGTRLQERARAARYSLLCAHCRAIGAPILLTAHHGDDQAETVLMRLGRGSGIAGLAAMRRRTVLPCGIVLVRPLLGCSKAELVASCHREGLPFAVDPSNEDGGFHRVRLRRQAVDASALGLTPAVLHRLARRMARADAALEAEVARLWSAFEGARWSKDQPGDIAAWRDAAPEIVQRLLGRLVGEVAGARRLPLERLERLADAVCDALAAGRAFRGTIGGTCLTLDAAGRLAVTRELERRRGRPRPD